MGNHFCHIVLAPEVSRSQIESFAKTLRAEQSRPTALTLCDLSGRSVRKPAYVAAKEAGVRLLEVESQLGHNVLIAAATRTFGTGFLYREKDDEGLAVCHPNGLWISNTFKRDDLDWLLELPEERVPWSREGFYALPGNPPESPVTLGIQARFLRPARPNEVRECPMCGTAYQSKRERGQCPNRDCFCLGTVPIKRRGCYAGSGETGCVHMDEMPALPESEILHAQDRAVSQVWPATS